MSSLSFPPSVTEAALMIQTPGLKAPVWKRSVCHYTMALMDALVFIAVQFLARTYFVDAQITWYSFENAHHVVSQSTGIDPFLLLGSVCLIYFFLKGQYSQRRPFWDELRPVSRALLLCSIGDALILAIAGAPHALKGVLVSWALVAVGIPLMRQGAKRALAAAGLWQIPTIIFGTGVNARQTATALLGEPTLGFRVKAFIALSNQQEGGGPPATGSLSEIPVVRMTDALMRALQEKNGPHVVLALEEDEMAVARDLINALALRPEAIDIVPPVRGMPLYGLEVNHLLASDMLMLRVRNNLVRRGPRLMKRLLDLFGAMALLIALLPLFLLLMLLVRQSGRSVFYGHVRIGQNGKPFKCLKFRTMVPNSAEVLAALLARDPVARAEWERDFKLKNDIRVTPVGRFLRRTSLDELPQLLNVLCGDMSLVGPRPIVAAELERYGDNAPFYLQIKPGITGLWQVRGRNDVSYEQRVFLDAWYVKNWSLWYDMMILLRTVVVVCNRDGAY